jgi:hypothetical protein
MGVPHFFSEPDYNQNSEINLEYHVDTNMSFVRLYDITHEKMNVKNKLQIMSIKCDNKNYIILYTNTVQNELYGPCIIFNKDIADIREYIDTVEFTGISLAQINVYESHFKHISMNTKITSHDVNKILYKIENTKPILNTLFNKIISTKITECDDNMDLLQKCTCYKDIYKNLNHTCTTDLQKSEKEKINKNTELEKIKSQLKNTQNQLKQCYIITTVFLFFILVGLLLNDKDITIFRLYIYLIIMGLLVLYLTYLVWF